MGSIWRVVRLFLFRIELSVEKRQYLVSLRYRLKKQMHVSLKLSLAFKDKLAVSSRFLPSPSSCHIHCHTENCSFSK